MRLNNLQDEVIFFKYVNIINVFNANLNKNQENNALFTDAKIVENTT